MYPKIKNKKILIIISLMLLLFASSGTIFAENIPQGSEEARQKFYQEQSAKYDEKMAKEKADAEARAKKIADEKEAENKKNYETDKAQKAKELEMDKQEIAAERDKSMQDAEKKYAGNQEKIDTEKKRIQEKYNENLKEIETNNQKRLQESQNNYDKRTLEIYNEMEKNIESFTKEAETKVNSAQNFERAIESDKDRFDVGTLLRANNQKTFLDRAKESKQPVIIAIIDYVSTFLLKLAIPLAILALVVAGFMMMTAQGEDNQVGKAKDVVKGTLIGLAIMFASYLIVQFIISIFYQGV